LHFIHRLFDAMHKSEPPSTPSSPRATLGAAQAAQVITTISLVVHIMPLSTVTIKGKAVIEVVTGKEKKIFARMLWIASGIKRPKRCGLKKRK